MKTLSAIKYLLVFFLFAGMGCQDIVVYPTFTIGKESSFRINQLYTSSDGQYTLQISDIGDSRCPDGAMCFWSGEVSLKGEWTANKTPTAIELHTVIKDMEKQPEGFTIQIVDAKPYPKISGESKPADLVITLLIQKKSKLDAISFTHSMKGWELYSWLNGNDWNYSILVGTNRAKSYSEVVTNKVSVIGKDSLKILLDKFPASEEIFWTGKRSGDDWVNFSFPDGKTVDEIKNYCTQKDLALAAFN